MCKTPSIPAPKAPTQYAAQKTPTRADQAGASERMTQQLRSPSTILTGPLGVTQGAEVGKKTLLGQ
jgi:hypothetical protein